MAVKASAFGGLDASKTLAENAINAKPVVLDSNVSLTSKAANGFQGGNLQVKIANATDADNLSINEVGGITVAKDAASGSTFVFYNGARIGTVTNSGTRGSTLTVVFVDGPVSNAAATALARSIAYSSHNDAPSPMPRSLTFSAIDAQSTTFEGTMKLALKAENDATVLTGLGPSSSHLPADAAGGFVIDGDAHISNPDGSGFRGGKLVVHLAGAVATDQLYLSAGRFTISGTKLLLDGNQVGTVSANGASGHDLTFTFSGNAVMADPAMSALVHQVSYRSTAASLPTQARDVTFTLTDFEKSTASAHVALVFQNQAPSFLSSSGPAGLSVVATGAVGQYASGSLSPVVSADGTEVAFVSSASGLLQPPGSTAIPRFSSDQILLKNLKTGEVSVASADAAGTPGNGASSAGIAISADGSKVAFVSTASNLVAGDTNGVADVFVKDLKTGAITRISTDAAGGQANAKSVSIAFSPDGTKVAFASTATNLVAGDTNGWLDVFVKDLATGAITRVSTSAAGVQANNMSSTPVFSPDGTKIAFFSDADNLVPHVKPMAIYVKDLATGDLAFVSQTGGPNQLVFSPDGTKVAFVAYTDAVVPGSISYSAQLYVKDLTSGTVMLVSSDASGANAFAPPSGRFSFSPDGTKVVFASYASNLVPGDTNGSKDIFVKDLTTGAITRIVAGSAGDSTDPSFTPDGAHVVFSSTDPFLVPGHADGGNDIYMVAVPQSSVTTATLVEDPKKAALTARGTVFFADQDAADNHIVSVTAAAGTLGTLSAKVVSDVGGTGAVVWSYAVDEAKVAPLAAGESRVETFTLKLDDQHGGTVAQNVTVTLTGTADGSVAPVVASFALAAQDQAAAGGAASPWAALADSLGGVRDEIHDAIVALEERLAAHGQAHPEGGLSTADLVADLAADLPSVLAGFLGAFGGHGSVDPAATHAPAPADHPTDLADAFAARVWDALHLVRSGDHLFV